MEKKRAEVLAPVGNRQMLEAAVRAGADAVYLGMSAFNARRNAENFSDEEYRKAVEYCHERGVRVYLTLNTLIAERELPRALSAAAFAYRCGTDAVIVQDLGLAAEISRAMPDFEMHASTQMSIHNAAALPLLARLGFSQVVAAREMSREELSRFCARAAECALRVEVFVHGALCMSVSGQCYMSAFIGGRSGNRGLCAGPCRLPCSVKEGEYDLSLKDLSLVSHIEELISLGVSSLKIEGRMKRPEYVAAATAVCRRAVDGEHADEWREALESVFSRSGFTDGYYTGRLGRGMFGIREREDVLLTASVLSKLHSLYRAERRSVAVEARFVADSLESECRLTLSDGEHVVTVSAPAPLLAKTVATTREEIHAALAQMGNTPYYLESLEVLLAEGAFLPASVLKSLRRRGLEALSTARKATDRPEVSHSFSPAPFLRKQTQSALVARFADPSQLPETLTGVCAVIVPLECDLASLPEGVERIVETPRWIASEQSLAAQLERARSAGVRAVMCTNLGAVMPVLDAGLVPIFDFTMNLYNAQSIETAKSLGAVACVVSPELRAQQIAALGEALPLGMLAYGRVPLMLTKNCPVKNRTGCQACAGRSALIDRKGTRFPVRCRGGYSEVLNSAPIWLADKRADFPVDFRVLYFTVETATECARVIERYRAGDGPEEPFTRGLYYRGVE